MKKEKRNKLDLEIAKAVQLIGNNPDLELQPKELRYIANTYKHNDFRLIIMSYWLGVFRGQTK